MLKMINKICDLKVNFDDDKHFWLINKKIRLKMRVLGVEYLNYKIFYRRMIFLKGFKCC